MSNNKLRYLKRVINNKEYYYFRLRHENLKTPKDFYSTNLKELERKIAKAKLELDNNLLENNILYLNFFKNWLFEVHFVNKKFSTKEKYEGLYRNYIKDNQDLKKIKLKDLNINILQNFYNNIYAAGASESIIKNIHKLIAPNLRYAFFNNMILKDFSKGLTLPKDHTKTKKSVVPFSLEEQFKFIDAIKGHDLEVLFLTALNTGLRQGELFALEWSDLDFNSNLISVTKSVSAITEVDSEGRGTYKIVLQSTKTEKSIRFVPMPIFLRNKLLEHKLAIESYKEKLSNLYENKNLVFPNAYGGYLNTSNVRKRFKKVLATNEIKEIKFHDLRHTFATRLFEVGEEPKIIQELLGHSNISITLDTYTHVLDKLKVNAVSKLDSLYNRF